jgi:peptidoglycan glycosyltransferase
MDRRIRQIAGLITILLLAVTVSAGWVQGVRSEEISSNEPNGARNLFRIFQECRWRRGPILSIDGETLADTKRVPKGHHCLYQRTYPSGDLAAGVVGQWSLYFQKTGIENAYQKYLIGGPAPAKSISDLFRSRPRIGNTVVSTLDTRLQKTAIDALAGRRGGVVAMNPKTGAVLVAASVPSYDPNPLASNDRKTAQAAECALGNGDELDADGNLKRDASGKPIPCVNYQNPLVPVALQAHRPPGSAFKVVTAAAALDSGKFTPDSDTGYGGSYLPPGDTKSLGNFGGEVCGGTLANALRVSCNTSFARVAVAIGADQLYATAAAMGLDEQASGAGGGAVGCDAKPDPSIAWTFTGCVPRKHIHYDSQGRPFYESLSTPGFLARAGFGQWDVEVSPFGMAVVAATVANGGFVPRPRFVDRILDPSGATIEDIRTGIGASAISPQAAGELTQMMRGVVTGGTAAGAFSGFPIPVAGKTGTAQAPACAKDEVAIFGPGCGKFAHAWFICFAPVQDPTIAVAVLVERGGLQSQATGGQVAAPIARKVLEKYFELYPTTAGR